MLGWFKLTQGITDDLQSAARIIAEQNPNSLRWAQDRLSEFLQTLACDYELTPDRNHNGFDWSGSYNKDEDDLIFFDHYYGVTKNPYEDVPATLRLGLQCVEGGDKAETFFEAKLSLDFRSEEDSSLGHGEIRLVGQRGVWWSLDGSFCAQVESKVCELVNHFGSFVSDVYQDSCLHRAHFNGHISAKQARELFKLMVQCFIANRG